MILYDAVNIKAGSEQVIEIRVGAELVWTAGFWSFDIPIGGEEIQFNLIFSGEVNAIWGDGDIDVLTSGVPINHIYDARLTTITQLGLDIDGEAAYDYSGHSVSMNDAGDRIVIGAIQNDDNGNHSGHTRIFEWRQYTSNDVGLYHYESRLQNGTQSLPLIITEDFITVPVVGDYYWIQLGLDIDGEAVEDQSGYSVSMNSEGNRIAIGAPQNYTYFGHTKIYEYNVSTQAWDQLGDNIDGEVADDRSGYSVSINATGDRIVIGAPGSNGNIGSNSGLARIYEYNGTNWEQLGQDIFGEAIFDQSGYSVNMNSEGNRIAIGAIGNNSNTGHTRIYEYDGANWTQLGQNINGEAGVDGSSWSVSMNSTGNRVAIGAVFNDGINGADSGHTRIYEYNVSTQAWDQLGDDIDGEAAYDLSGFSVSMNAAGNQVAIGAVWNDGNGFYSGHTRIYEYDVSTQAWTQLGSDIDGEAAEDESGCSVSMNSTGNRVAIGARYNDGNGSSSGHTRIYKLDSNY